MSPPKPEILLRMGLIHDGMPTVMKHNLPWYVDVDERDPQFHGRIKVRASKVRMIWSETNEECSMTEAAKAVLKRFRPQGERPASGPVYWGTATTSFYDWAERITGSGLEIMKRYFSHAATRRWASRLSGEEILLLEKLDKRTGMPMAPDDWAPWREPPADFEVLEGPKGLPLVVGMDPEAHKPFLQGDKHSADGTWHWNFPWDGSASPFAAALQKLATSRRPAAFVSADRRQGFHPAGVGFVRRKRQVGFVLEGAPPGLFAAVVQSYRDEVPPAYWTWDESGRDLRRRAERLAVIREGQSNFREDLVKAYDGRCAVTGYEVDVALQAAHIRPYRGAHTNHVSNGLLLRADIHLLFDAGLLYFEPSLQDPRDVKLSLIGAAKDSGYAAYEHQNLHLTAKAARYPDREALELHRDYALSLIDQGQG